MIQVETLEPNKTLIRSVRRNLKGLGQEELIDLIHTLTVGLPMAQTKEGRRTLASYAMGVMGLMTASYGPEITKKVIESANEYAVHIAKAWMEYDAKQRCEQCGQCDTEPPPDPHSIN